MSEDKDNGTMLCCASCGIAEVDDIKLKKCTACYLVRYCSIKCQKDHRPQHRRACKKRAAELRDELLFKQPESSYPGDCPICCLPMPIDNLDKLTMKECCSKVICNGCGYTNQVREWEMRVQHTCPFCREPRVETREQSDKRMMKRIEMNDPAAMSREGGVQYNKGEYSQSVEYWTKAAKLGDLEAHYRLAGMYREGQGVEKDRGKEMYHLEEAAIGGHPIARYQLGVSEYENGNTERAVKHWIIAAAQGFDGSLAVLRGGFAKGIVGKDTFAAALRAHQAAVNATKSPQRETAEEYYRNRKPIPV